MRNSGKRTTIFIVLALLVLASLSHIPGMLTAEFTGEDEMLFISVGKAFLGGLKGDLNQLYRVFSFYYPPMQAMLPAPLVGLFGVSPWTIRLPGALAGILSAPLLFILLKRNGANRKTAVLAGLMMAIGSVAANNYYALCCGIFSGFALLGAFGLAEFIDATDERKANRSLFLGAVGIVGAMMTLQDGFFYMPVLAAVYWSRRRWRIPWGAWPAVGLVAGWITAYLLLWIVLPGLIDSASAGGVAKIKLGLSSLGAFRGRDLLLSFVAGSSWLAVFLSIPLLPLGWCRASRSIRWVVVYYAFPLFLWTFILNYSNVRAAHMLLAFPAYSLLWAIGAVTVAEWLGARMPLCAAAWKALVVLALVSMGWQTLVLHLPSPLPQSAKNFFTLQNYYPQGRSVEVFGQRAAGLWIQKHSDAHTAVICNLGGSFGDFYARRTPRGRGDLIPLINDPGRARREDVRYYVHALSGPSPAAAELVKIPVAAEVVRKGAATLRIYDLWQENKSMESLN